MTGSVAWNEVEDALIRLGEFLEKPTALTVIGSAVCMSLGQPGRMTIDVDVWRRTSKFDLGDLKRACQKAGIDFNPQTYGEPDRLYLQLVEPGIVQLGEFEATAEIATVGNLALTRPPIENLVASKLVRGEARDYDDIVFMVSKCGVTQAQIEAAIATIPDKMARETAQENLVMLEIVLNAGTPRPSPSTLPRLG